MIVTTDERAVDTDERSADERAVDTDERSADERAVDTDERSADERAVGADERTDDGRTIGPGREPVLELDGISHTFGDVTVLDDVDVSLPAGCATALVGANGTGKTTLLRIAAGLLSPDAGTVRLATNSPRRVGYLPQSPSFRPVFTAAETLSFYADLLPVDVDVHRALEAVGLADVADRRVDALSGGMRRLLGIAQATLGEPDVILLDEPTGDLDPRMTRRVFETIERLAADGVTVLLATHNLTGASTVDRVLLLDRGTVVANGSPAALLEESESDTLTDAFVRVTNEGETAARVRSGANAGIPSGGRSDVDGDDESHGDGNRNGGSRDEAGGTS